MVPMSSKVVAYSPFAKRTKRTCHIGSVRVHVCGRSPHQCNVALWNNARQGLSCALSSFPYRLRHYSRWWCRLEKSSYRCIITPSDNHVLHVGGMP